MIGKLDQVDLGVFNELDCYRRFSVNAAYRCYFLHSKGDIRDILKQERSLGVDYYIFKIFDIGIFAAYLDSA